MTPLPKTDVLFHGLEVEVEMDEDRTRSVTRVFVRDEREFRAWLWEYHYDELNDLVEDGGW